MKNTKLPELTFAWLDAQIEALPAGPAAILSTPRWTRYWTMIGVAGLVSVLLPSLLLHLQWWQVDRWMVTQAQIGLAIAVLGFAPGFARNIWVLVQGFRHQRRGLIEQFDHDTRKFRALSEELSAYPRVVLERQSRQAAMGHERLTGQLVILLGGIERLGLLPLLLSLFVVLRNWEDLLALPLWLAMLGIMAPILWLIGWGGAEFRRRLQLYEFLLDEALIVQGIRNEKAGKREQRVTEGPKTS